MKERFPYVTNDRNSFSYASGIDPEEHVSHSSVSGICIEQNIYADGGVWCPFCLKYKGLYNWIYTHCEECGRIRKKED